MPQTRDMCVQLLAWSGSKNNFCAGAERVHERILNGKTCRSHYSQSKAAFHKNLLLIHGATIDFTKPDPRSWPSRCEPCVREFYRFSPRLDLHCALSAGTSQLTPTSSDSGHRGAGNPGLSPHFVILNKWGSQWSRPLPHTDLHLIRADTHAASFLSCCVGLCHGLWSHLSFYLTNNKKERKNAPRDVHGK